MQSIFKSLTAELSNCMHSDRFRFKRRLQAAQKLPSEIILKNVKKKF